MGKGGNGGHENQSGHGEPAEGKNQSAELKNAKTGKI